MIEQYHLMYKDNAKEQEKTHKFKTTYNSTSAVQWYTDDSFLYKLINRAFRTEHFDFL
jgi:hypothetical protein